MRGIQPCGSRRTGHNYAQTITRYESKRIAYDLYWNDCHRGGARYTDNRNIHRTHHTVVGSTTRNAESESQDFLYEMGLWDREGSSWALELKSIGYGHAHQRWPATHSTCPICALHHTRVAHRCQNPTCPRSGNNKPVPSCCPTSPPHCCNCGNDHTATFRECPARPPPTVPTRTNSPAPAPTGQDPMDLAVDGGPAPSTPPTGEGPREVDLVTLRQPPPAGPSTRPGTTHGFRGSSPPGGAKPFPCPFDSSGFSRK